MRRLILKRFIIYSFSMLVLFQCSCSGVYDAIVNIQRLQFKLNNVTKMELGGVNVSGIGSLSDFSFSDGAALLANFTQGKFPVSFTLNVLAKNPNDGTGGTKNTSAVIKNLAWRLFLDNKETVNGNIGGITVPGVGQATTIPI